MTDLSGLCNEMWESLRLSKPSTSNEYVKLPIFVDQVDTGLMAAMTSDGRPRLLIPIKPIELESEKIHVDLRGLSLSEESLKLGATNKHVIDISSTPAEESMFTVVAKELVRSVVIQGRDPREATESLIRRWRAYWSTQSRPMTFEAELGLFAELHLLNNILFPKFGPSAVFSWKGPMGERHDFQSNSWHIECKATSKAAPIFEIHGHDQLFPPDNKPLILYSFLASKESSSSTTLNNEIQSIREQLANHQDELNYFEDCLLSLGFERNEDSLHLRIRRADFYRVDHNFPDLGLTQLPSGVVNINWEIDLSDMPAMDTEEWDKIFTTL